MFAGSNRLTIDDKGRLAIPARVRGQLADEYGRQIAVTLGPECIEIYPAQVFRQVAEKLSKIPDRSKRMVAQRMFVGYAIESELDAQGRIVVPPTLRSHDDSRLGSDVMLVGAINHFELWPAAQWLAVTTESLPTYADAFAALDVS